MTQRRIISELADKPIEEIRAELEQVQAERVRLEIEEQLLTQMLRLRQWETSDQPSPAEGVKKRPATDPQHRRENITTNVLAVVKQAAGQSLAPADVRAQLSKHGVSADLNSVRQALRRWVERGALGKGDGRYFDPRPQSRSFDYADIMSQLSQAEGAVQETRR